MGLKLNDPQGKSHQTALVVDGEEFAKGGRFNERIRRLLQSLNGQNIKVDVFAKFGDEIIRCNEKTLEPLATPATSEVGESAIELLTARGYAVVLPAVKGKVD